MDRREAGAEERNFLQLKIRSHIKEKLDFILYIVYISLRHIKLTLCFVCLLSKETRTLGELELD